MKILATTFAFSLLLTTVSAFAQSEADGAGKQLVAGNYSPNIISINSGRVIAGGLGVQTLGSGSLRMVEYIQSPATVLPVNPTKELLAYNDSLKNAAKLQIRDDSLKAAQYLQLAGQYMNYDTISNKKEKLNYQNEAISYTLKAIHYYSKCNDTTGLRTSFDILAKVYHAEKKYTQAKWFVLQSNNLSRVKNDVPNIISSLLVLASIKSEIKDYDLAMRDLNEAMKLADSSHTPKTAASVQLGYVMLYNNMKNYAKADIALKRYNFINDSLRRGEIAKLANAADSVQRKKKFYLTSSRRLSKTSSSKKIALL